ncbi:MAG TPA: alpha/beta hydrolase [Elusimicrobiota bacterium]|jgi:pimeloyl-ACP methyl ester carboxylesterase|nr:alpha/beta hydrolase [Elusimicrobiota bacterium]
MGNQEIRFIEANGLRFAYLEQGAGPLALLLHGFPDTAGTWDHLRPRIAAAGYRVVTPFMRGYRPTAVPERDADPETLAGDVVALIEALGESSAVVIGHDWGALAAYGAASLRPDRVRRLLVLAIAHPAALRLSPPMMWAMRHFFAYKLPGAPGRFARHDFAALPAIYRRWSPAWSPAPEEFTAVRECFSDRASLNAAFGYYRALTGLPSFLKRRIGVPTVAFAGLDDPLLRPADYRKAARMFSNGYAVEEAPGGHFLHREHPDAFAARLLARLDVRKD